jgi:hypothetical protein
MMNMVIGPAQLPVSRLPGPAIAVAPAGAATEPENQVRQPS